MTARRRLSNPASGTLAVGKRLRSPWPLVTVDRARQKMPKAARLVQAASVVRRTTKLLNQLPREGLTGSSWADFSICP
jgi:hypothetical protein